MFVHPLATAASVFLTMAVVDLSTAQTFSANCEKKKESRPFPHPKSTKQSDSENSLKTNAANCEGTKRETD
jgi:hypothetical protein